MSNSHWEVSMPPGDGHHVLWMNGDEVLRSRYNSLYALRAHQFYRPHGPQDEQRLPEKSLDSIKCANQEASGGDRNVKTLCRNEGGKKGGSEQPLSLPDEELYERLVEAHALLGALIKDCSSNDWWMLKSGWLQVDHESGNIHKLDLFKNALSGPDILQNVGGTHPLEDNRPRADWVALLAMKSVVKPKFKWLSSIEPINPNSDKCPLKHKRKRRRKRCSFETIPAGNSSLCSTGASRDLSGSKKVPGTCQDLFNTLHINPLATPAVGSAHESTVLIPAMSNFLMSDLTAFRTQAKRLTRNGKFDVIVLDPPWENRSVKRQRQYQTLPNWSLLEMPIQELMREDGCLVCIWMTNRPKHLAFVNQELLPSWGLKEVTSWIWLKVDSSGQMLCNPRNLHHKPYERLLLTANTNDDMFQEVLKDVLVMAMPGEHSRKPPLGEVLSTQLSKKVNCLELFARELIPNWSSWGNEVLRFQATDCVQSLL